MGLSRYTIWSAADMGADLTSDVIWLDGDDFSAQFYSESDTRVGDIYLDGTNDGPADASPIWTTLATFAVGAGVALNRLETVVAKPVAGIRLRWERTGGAGTIRATVAVQQIMKE